MDQGNLVLRKSYGGDVLFRIEDIQRERAILKGVEFRLLADSPLADLVPVREAEAKKYLVVAEEKWGQTAPLVKKRNQTKSTEQPDEQSHFHVPGKVLHLDGDRNYLQKCMPLYKKYHVPAEGYYVTEQLMAQALQQLLLKSKPDIVVITGHDGILKKDKRRGSRYDLSNYRNSAHFVKAVQTARQFDRGRDSLIIIAGACQSHFEALLGAGANFASSPGRTLIHALDPLFIACKMALTSIRETVDIAEVIRNTISGSKGIGGIETRGTYRAGYPATT